MAEKEEPSKIEETDRESVGEELEAKESSQNRSNVPADLSASKDAELSQRFEHGFHISNKQPPETPKCLLDKITFEGIAKYIASDKCRKIVTMAGAGISTSSGIPDFRSPGTGLYDNLQKYNLPHPSAIFELEYFMNHPEAFFTLAKELYPGSFKPTPCHYFIRLLDEKKKLLMHFTQNIDTLERAAGLSGDKIIEAHGTFHTSHCLKCQKEYSQDWIKEKVFADLIPRCGLENCNGLVKPDIVFFGEQLPEKFFEKEHVLEECDMLIILGTSLVVQPFASLMLRVKKNTPRLYINLEEPPGNSLMAMFDGGFQFDAEDNIRDVFWEGTCDDGCYALADLLGWGKKLKELVKTEHSRIDKETAAEKKHKPSSEKQHKQETSSASRISQATTDGTKSKSRACRKCTIL